MTKQEFIRRHQAMNEINPRRIVSGTAPFALFVASLMWLPRWIEKWDDMPWLAPAAAVALLVVMAGSIAVIFRLVVRQQNRYGHRCPACGKAVLPAVAIATGNCVHCGGKAFEEEQAT